MTPEENHHDFGWIVPAGPRAEFQAVAEFVEKPDGERARELRRQGALLNSLIFAGTGRALLNLYALCLPDLVGEFVTWRDRRPRPQGALKSLYEELPTIDFSREVLERSAEYLGVARVPPCGWTDLGTPDRLIGFRRRATAPGRRVQQVQQAAG
jgi:mannose-1-phosphate guanylyltransferase